MKKLFACLTILALLMTACAAPESDAAKLEYPGLPWGSSPETVKEVLSIREEDLFREQEDAGNEKLPYDSYAFQVKDLELFGQKSVSAVFQFQDYTKSGHYALAEIVIYYPDGYHAEAVDRSAVQAALEALYGPILESCDTYTWHQGDIHRTGTWPTVPTWHAETTVYDLMTDEELELFIQSRLKVLENRDEETLPTREQIQLIEDISVARITFHDACTATSTLTDEKREEFLWTDNELVLTGRSLVSWEHTYTMVEAFMAEA